MSLIVILDKMETAQRKVKELSLKEYLAFRYPKILLNHIILKTLCSLTAKSIKKIKGLFLEYLTIFISNVQK
jgi:hypothetical protein